ncbi:O-linked GlcNAc transferase [Solibacillus sp. MA9]|uniref:O-linked GlcNAc transferase n=1 Tax=Solibacillus palustris TaxID=2908203 RepID=A0ABS9UAX7_9BACL|nr:O-linked GlcNAc transferase [Solibacillus sp. MA9]MCH7321130.1 O-linked GlcNAc transferase [Solibacillus sp. MA9]
MMNMEQYFYDGQFLKSYKAALQDLTNESRKQYLVIFEKYEYANFPQPTAQLQQSIERANESYEELDEVEQLRAIQDEGQFAQTIKELENDARTSDDVRKAESFFVQAQLFLMAHHYDESIHCFMQAVKHNPNKALYYGFAGQTMNRFSWSPFDTLPYIERAIDLDLQNARWYWNKALVLTQLYKDLQAEPFLENALIAIEKAIEVCREDQISLRNGIDSTLENLKEYLFN